MIVDGDAGKFQAKFTTFLREHLSLFSAPQHKQNVYQALCFMLMISTNNCDYDIEMEHDDGFGRADITAHPRTPDCLLSLVFESRAVSTHQKKRGKRTLKPFDLLKTQLTNATDEALRQIESRQYRARAPPYTRKIHEYGIAFAGKCCVAVVRTLHREADAGDWVEVNRGTVVVPEDIPDTDLVGVDADDDEMDGDE